MVMTFVLVLLVLAAIGPLAVLRHRFAPRRAPPLTPSVGSRAVEVRKVGVVGLGAMGAGIAQLCVEAGVDTVGREVTAELGEQARDRIGHFLTRKTEKGQLEQVAAMT